MQERPRSIVMPGAHLIEDSAYISIYFKSDYIFSILVEKPVTRKNDIKSFEYYELCSDN